MMNEKSLVQYLIGSARIKYNVLDELYEHQFMVNPYMSPYRKAIMYVDAQSIYFRLFREKDLTAMYADSAKDLIQDLTVGFMNVLGHYRRYMATRWGLDNEIYVIFNYTPAKYQMSFCPEFNHKLYAMYDENAGYLAEAVKTSWKFVQSLAPYFDQIYCVNGMGIDTYSICAKSNLADDTFYTIFSRSMYGTQLIKNNVVQLFNRRDKSRLITVDSCYSEGILYNLRTKADYRLTPGTLPLLFALGGCKDVDVKPYPGITNLSHAVKIINHMVHRDELTPDMSIQSFIDAVLPYISEKKITMDLDAYKNGLKRRYIAMNAQLGASAIPGSSMAKIEAQCYNVYDQNMLEQLNELMATNINADLLEINNLNMSTGR